jgi:A/G-specific adenine glycosylase
MSTEATFRTRVLEWGGEHSRSFPWRRTSDPYAVLIGEVLLQRTRGEHVVDVFERFVQRWPSADELAAARVASIASVIRPLGLAKRAPLLKRLGDELRALGQVPLEPAALQRLPGVGPYAAHAVPVFAADRDLPLIDWVIARAMRRYFGLPTDRRPNADRELWALAERLADRGRARDLWLGSLDLAAAVCRPRPLCGECPLARSCDYAASRGSQAVTPRRRITTM